jgi:spermidine synthase
LHLLVLFVTSMVCHRELALSRPVTTHLTEFYLWISVGGLLGSVFSVLVAPAIFDSIFEYPLAIILACLLRPSPVSRTAGERWRDVLYPAVLLLFWLAPQSGMLPMPPDQPALLIFYGLIALALYSFRHRPVRLALGMAIFVLGGHWMVNAGHLLQVRTFFGVYTVSVNPEGKVHALIHGNTVHGLQATDPAYTRYPLGYYYRDGPLGQLIMQLNHHGGLHRIGVLGLGIGTLACYVRPGQQLTFYEIDPMVEAIARNTRLFRYLDACGDVTDVVLGDGRLKLAGAPDGHYDLLVLDAFSSDAIPVHLLTREALQLYLRKLSPDGILLFHVSNRYVQLAPVLARLAEDAGLSVRKQFYQPSEHERRLGAYPSNWVIMARNEEMIKKAGPGPHWEPLSATPDTRLWTDDYADLFSALIWPKLLW